jgi:L-methionine (R)-S-oxide reductase
VNWCGFYVVDLENPKQLILGPFQGHVACQTIAFGKGVCGTAAASLTTQLVEDVDEFPGHIACDSASKSEIVVPIMQKGEVRQVSLGINMCMYEHTDGENRSKPS